MMRKMSLTPWRGLLGPQHGEREREHPLDVFHREFDRLFENLWRDVELPMLGYRAVPMGLAMPRMDVTEDENRLRVTVELPGMEEKDVEVVLSDNVLTIKGEKKAETEEVEKTHAYMERSYGAFCRRLPLDVEIVSDKVEATFDKGVLTVDLPKTAEAKRAFRKVPIRTVAKVKKLEKAA